MNINPKIYSMYRVDALRTPGRLRAGYPTLLQWRGRYDLSRHKTSPWLPTRTCGNQRSVFVRVLFFKMYTFYLQSVFHMHSTRNIINYLVTVIVFSLAVFRFVESCHTQCPRVNDITARLSFLHTMQLKVNIPAKPMSTIPVRMMDEFSY